MAPGIIPPEPTFTVKEMTKTAKEKHNFGAVIDDLNLDTISGKCIIDSMPGTALADILFQTPMWKRFLTRSGLTSSLL